jgi:hypothetical protein
MNWVIVIVLGLLGVVMGTLSVNGYTQRIEPLLWLLLMAVATIVVVKNVSTGVFLHGFCIGMVWGILNGVIQCLFFDRYLISNPDLKDQFGKVTFMPVRYFPLLTGPLTGIVAGLILGGVSVLVKKIW